MIWDSTSVIPSTNSQSQLSPILTLIRPLNPLSYKPSEPPPPKVVIDNTFQGSSVAIATTDDVIPALNALFSDLRCARGTKNIYAYRLHTPAGLVEYFDDDGEHGAGRRILQQLRTANLTGTLVCVTRWCGKLLGPVRLEHIAETALSVINLK